LDIVALVAGQENYGLAVVSAGEAIWSFLKSPTMSNVKVLIPGLVAAIVLAGVSGPLVTSGDAASVGTGLWIATGVSVALGLSYVLRLLSKYSETPKEIAGLGLLVAVAGLFSFGQNLIVDGFVSLPSIELPSLPQINIELPSVLPELDPLGPDAPEITPSELLPSPSSPASVEQIGQDVGAAADSST